MTERRVLIVGGGLAGLACATVLAERGLEVRLFEKESFFGGRVGAWTDRLSDGTPFEMERGFHAFFRNYHNLRALLRRVDPGLDGLLPLTDYPLLGPGGARESFADLPRITPLNVMELVRRTPSLTLRDLTKVHVPSALEMLRFDPKKTYQRWDGQTARQYLDGLRFPPDARRMLFEVFAHSFFNPEDEYSAAELLAMFHFYFLGNPEGLPFDVMKRPFSHAFVTPLVRYLEARGAVCTSGVEVERIEREGERWAVHIAGERVLGDGLVLATNVPGMHALLDRSGGVLSGPTERQLRSLEVTAPFAVLRRFYDRPAPAGASAFAGTAGVGILDNISVYEHFEDESGAIAAKRSGSVIELHAYGLPRDMNEDAIRADLIEGFLRLYPEMRGANVTDERFLLRADCPAFAPGSHALRPTVETSFPDLSLAGDYVKLPFASALMERATTSGMLSANVHLRRFGLRPERIRTGPRMGVLTSGSWRHAGSPA
jgi:isorenieratene synthase